MVPSWMIQFSSEFYASLEKLNAPMSKIDYLVITACADALHKRVMAGITGAEIAPLETITAKYSPEVYAAALEYNNQRSKITVELVEKYLDRIRQDMNNLYVNFDDGLLSYSEVVDTILRYLDSDAMDANIYC